MLHHFRRATVYDVRNRSESHDPCTFCASYTEQGHQCLVGYEVCNATESKACERFVPSKVALQKSST